MTFVASLLLLFVLVIRPQEIWPSLESLRLLDVLTALAMLGLLVEVALGKQKRLYSPQLPFLAAFVVTGYVVTVLALGVSRGVTLGNNDAAIPAVFMLAIMYGSRTMRRLKGMLWALVLIAAFVSAVAVHQGSVSPVCIEKKVDESGDLNPDIDTADARICSLPSDCREYGHWDVEWACERIGLFRTISAGRRVRWRGQLDDPNELSVFIGAVIPLVFVVAWPGRNAGNKRGRLKRAALAIVAVVIVCLGLWAVVLSQSRGGQLVIATVFMLLFVSRFGKKGVLLAILLALPVLLLGGRGDAEADESSMDRLELLTEGVSLVIAHPFRGVGLAQFPDQVASPLHLTAHNSYLLAAAETGFPGFFFWSGIVWTSLKIPFAAMKRASLSADVKALATALVVSFSGIAVGIFFLSFTYKQLLFVWFGLAGAFYGLLREADPTLRVKVGWKDCAGVALADLAVIGLLWAYTRARGG